MKRLPIDIRGQEWELLLADWRPQHQGSRCVGLCDYDAKLITVWAGLRGQRLADTIAHEVAHAGLPDINEDGVNETATAIAAALCLPAVKPLIFALDPHNTTQTLRDRMPPKKKAGPRGWFDRLRAVDSEAAEELLTTVAAWEDGTDPELSGVTLNMLVGAVNDTLQERGEQVICGATFRQWVCEWRRNRAKKTDS
jgi:hypothetical protein